MARPGSPTAKDVDERWVMFGLSRRARILTVVYTLRRGRYRIISGRLATGHERKIYEEG